MQTEDLKLGAYYWYEDRLVRLVQIRRRNPYGLDQKVRAVIEHEQFRRLWVKPAELTPLD